MVESGWAGQAFPVATDGRLACTPCASVAVREPLPPQVVHVWVAQAPAVDMDIGCLFRLLGDDERQGLLAALKSKWDEVNALYQRITYRKISTSNSTMGEVRWKETCEGHLAGLEADIARLSAPGPMYVVEPTDK